MKQSCSEYFRLRQLLPHERQGVQQTYCIHPLRHWQWGQKEAKLETTVPAPAVDVIWPAEHLFLITRRGRGEEGERNLSNFQSPN